MIRIPLVVIALLIVHLTAYAQRTTYSIDNFDFRNGVKTVQPAATPKRNKQSGSQRDEATVP